MTISSSHTSKNAAARSAAQGAPVDAPVQEAGVQKAPHPTCDQAKHTPEHFNEQAFEDALVRLQNVNISYDGHHVVHDVCFSIMPGEIVGIVGESGAGKSTVLHSIVQLLARQAETTGAIYFQGRNLLELSEEQMQHVRGNNIATIFQNPGQRFDPLMKIGAQIEELYHVHEKPYQHEALVALMERMHFSNPQRVLRSYPHELSGGMLQRVAIVMGYIFEPKLLLADEPTSALDTTTQSAIVDELLELNATRNTAILMVTHNIALAGHMCHSLIVMDSGHIIEQGPSKSVLEHPQNERTRELLAAVPRFQSATQAQPKSASC